MRLSDNEKHRIYESIMNNVKKTLNKIINEANSSDGYWNNYNLCKKVASECKNRTEFAEKFYSAYKYSLKNGWLSDFFGELSKRPASFYKNYDNCKEEALKYKDEKEFMMKSPNAYKLAVKNYWIVDFYNKPELSGDDYIEDYDSDDFIVDEDDYSFDMSPEDFMYAAMKLNPVELKESLGRLMNYVNSLEIRKLTCVTFHLDNYDLSIKMDKYSMDDKWTYKSFHNLYTDIFDIYREYIQNRKISKSEKSPYTYENVRYLCERYNYDLSWVSRLLHSINDIDSNHHHLIFKNNFGIIFFIYNIIHSWMKLKKRYV